MTEASTDLMAHAAEPRFDAVLLPYQLAWVHDESPNKVCEQGRQEGYTWATACEAVMTAAKRKGDGGLDVYLMTTSRSEARDFIDECALWVEQLLHACPRVEERGWRDKSRDPAALPGFRIGFPSGLSIYALPSKPAWMRGKERCLAVFDNAAYHDLDAWLKATESVQIWGGRRAIISSHNGPDTGFYRYTKQVKASIADGQPIASLHSVFLNDALRQGLFRRACIHRQIEWTQAREDAWVRDLREQAGGSFDEEFLGIVARCG